jgi:hypothetical protein
MALEGRLTMKCSMRVAGAIGVGYLLGRRHKLRTATIMAVAAAAAGTTVGGIAMRRGAKLLANSGVVDKMPSQLGEIVDTVRGDLLDAGKAAASAAVTSKIDSLSDSLHDRADRLRNVGATAADGAGAAKSGEDEESGNGAREDDVTDSEDSYPEDDYDSEDDTDAAEDEDEAEDENAGPQAAEVEDEEADDKPVPRQRQATRRRPVATRARR